MSEYTPPWHCKMCDQPSSLCQCDNGPWAGITEVFEFLKAERVRLQSELEQLRAECGELRELLREAQGALECAFSELAFSNLIPRIDAALSKQKRQRDVHV